MHPGFLKYFYSTSWQLLSQLLRLTSALLVGTLVARYLGPAELGKLNFSIAVVSIVSAVAPLGLDTIILKQILQSKDRSNYLLGCSFFLKCVASVSIYIIMFLLLELANFDNDTDIMILILLGMSFFQSLNVIAVYFQSEVDGRPLGYSSIVTILVSCIVKFFLISYNATVVLFSAVYLLDSILLSMCYVFFYHRRGQSLFNWKFDRLIAKTLMKDSYPLLLTGIIVLIYMRIDQVMLKFMVGDHAVGNYSVAVGLAEVWYFIPTVISTSVFPAIVNAKKENIDLYNLRVQRLLTLMFWVSIVFALPMIMFSDWIVNFLYGPKFSSATDLLPIMAFTGVFVSLGASSGKWYILENLQALFFKRALLGMLFNIGLNLLLIPEYGAKGAAVATFFAYFMSAFMFDFFNAQTRALFFMKLMSPYGGFSRNELLYALQKLRVFCFR